MNDEATFCRLCKTIVFLWKLWSFYQPLKDISGNGLEKSWQSFSVYLNKWKSMINNFIISFYFTSLEENNKKLIGASGFFCESRKALTTLKIRKRFWYFKKVSTLLFDRKNLIFSSLKCPRFMNGDVKLFVKIYAKKYLNFNHCQNACLNPLCNCKWCDHLLNKQKS